MRGIATRPRLLRRGGGIDAGVHEETAGGRPVGDPEGDCGIAWYFDCGSAAAAQRFAAVLAAEGIRLGAPSGCCNLLHTPLVQGQQMAHPASPPFGPGWPGEHRRYDPAECPQTDGIVARMVCVAISPRLTGEHVEAIATAVIKAAQALP